MQRKYWIIGIAALLIVAFGCTMTGFMMGRSPEECPECPDVAVAADCPEAAPCPECEECPPASEAQVVEKEVTRIIEVEKEIEVIVTATPLVPVVEFAGPGTFMVNADIEPGTYRINGSCYWARLSCVTGEFKCIIANDNVEGQSYVEILSSDMAFETSGRCVFVKQ